MAVNYAQVRKTFGKPICEHQAIQLMLAEMATRYESGRLLTEAAAAAYGHVPVAPVNDVAQALENPFVTEQGLIVETGQNDGESTRLLVSPIRCPGEDMPQNQAPKTGADNARLLS